VHSLKTSFDYKNGEREKRGERERKREKERFIH